MEYNCTICQKSYSSYKSLWNHNKKYHPNTEFKILNCDNKKIHKYECEFCKANFTRKNNMIVHIKSYCNVQKKNTENVNMKNEIIELKKEILELKNNKEDIKSKINNTNNGIINNTSTVNNIIYINKTGTESLSDLSKQDIKEIFDKNIDSIGTFIKKINFNENLPSNHSFCTTNLDGPYLSVFDESKSKITKDRKKYFFEQLFCITINKMKELYEVNKSHFKKDKQEQIEDTLKRLTELQHVDMNTKIYKEMIKKLNMLSYNDREIIQETWKNKKVKSKVPRTFEEDLEMNSDNDIEYDSDNSSSSEQELNDKILTKNLKKNHIII
jgi:hypothetical protein